jgi:hypothetical protein
MDGTGEHYVKWNQPGPESQIAYDLTHRWDLKEFMSQKFRVECSLTVAGERNANPWVQLDRSRIILCAIAQ